MSREPSDHDVGPEDVRQAASICRSVLQPLASEPGQWERKAGDLEWSARKTLEHVVEALGFYARDLATPVLAFPDHEVSLVCDPRCTPAGVVEGMVQMAAVVSAVVTATAPEVRALHPFGMADRTGFAAMACDEMLIHTDDICAGLGTGFEPPAELCERVLARLFPWAPRSGSAWQRLRWANGRTELPGRPRLGKRWIWHAAPLDDPGAVVRQEQPGDEDGIRAVHVSAFETVEEAELVDALRGSEAFIPELSLVAVEGEEAVGHVLLTRVELVGEEGGRALALAPMGVRADRQRQGIGWRLAWAAIHAAERLGERLIVVLGHAGYYPRFGFVEASPLGIESPFDVRPEVWMALVLGPDHPRGMVRYPEPFGAADGDTT